MAFSATVTSPMKKAERISRSMAIYSGKVSISSYSQTLVELTAITKYFKPTSNATTGGFGDGIVSVQIDGPSSNGQIINWNYASGAFKCFQPVAGTTVSFAVDSNVGAGAALLFVSGGGASALHATSAVGNATFAIVAGSAAECAANIDVGTFGFVAIGYV